MPYTTVPWWPTTIAHVVARRKEIAEVRRYVLKKSFGTKFFIRCAEAQCELLVDITAKHLAKKVFCYGHSRGAIIFGHHTNRARIIKRASEVVKVKITAERTAVFLVACATPKCDGLISLNNPVTCQRTLCRDCGGSGPYVIMNFRTRSRFLYSHRDEIVRVHVEALENGLRRVKFFCKCKAARCKKEVWLRANNSREEQTGLCQTHAGLIRRLPGVERLYRPLKTDAAKRQVEFTLTIDDFEKLIKDASCHYCGVKVARPAYLNQGRSHRISASRHHLDRKDNNKGYTPENCVTACTTCNLTKFRLMSEVEMMIVGLLRSGRPNEAMSLIRRDKDAIARRGKTISSARFTKSLHKGRKS